MALVDSTRITHPFFRLLSDGKMIVIHVQYNLEFYDLNDIGVES